LIEWLLNEMDIGVARSLELAKTSEGRRAGNKQNWYPGSKQVVHPKGRIGRACVNMDEHRLAAACHLGVSARHVYRDILMRTENDFGRPKAVRFKPGQFFDERRVISAEVAKQIIDPDLIKSL
jgi:hypothetical protein